jgi:hypothetical protein
MKKEYDFSKAERGKFHRPDAKFFLPIYLDDEVQSYVQKIADAKHSDVNAVVNELLRSDMHLTDAPK